MTTKPAETTPKLCVSGVEPDRRRLFAKLRLLWREKTSESYAKLARDLDVPKQAITQWATGSGDKSPAPWHVVMTLCHELGLGVGVEPTGLRLYRLDGATAPSLE